MAENIESLRKEIKAMEKSEDYPILATGQGITTKLSCGFIKTSSIRAFEKMCTEKEAELKGVNQSHGQSI